MRGDVGEGERELLMSERASECVGELVTINVEAGDGLMVYLLSRKGGEGGANQCEKDFVDSQFLLVKSKDGNE